MKKKSHRSRVYYLCLEPRNLLAGLALNDGVVYLSGGVGNDTLQVTTDGQTLSASVVTPSQTYSDSFPVESVSRLRFIGGSGDDVIRNDTSIPSHASGNEGNDSYFGGAGVDIVFGGSGDDTLRLGDGDDWAFGGAGKDKVYGDAGENSIHGGDDDDQLFGGSASDQIRGAGGDDGIFGGDGKDFLFGQSGDDQINGGAGDDYIRGGLGSDEIFGAEGNDRILGGAGSNTIYGNDGNDLIDGGQDNDSIFGGRGDDYIASHGGYDDVSGGQGKDVIINGSGGGSLSGGSDDDFIRGGNEADSIVGDSGDDTILSLGGNDKVSGGDGNDTIYGGTGDDFVEGDQGNDFISGQEGADRLIGGVGDDRLNGGQDDDMINGGDGDDLIAGQSGNDSLYGDSGKDRLHGGNGRDGLFGGVGGGDRLTGGEGDDRLLPFAEGGSGRPRVIDRIVDKNREDAVLPIANRLTVSGSVLYRGEAWTNQEVQAVDASLKTLHMTISNSKLLKGANGKSNTLFKFDEDNKYAGVNFRRKKYIGIAENILSASSNSLDSIVFHEFAHNWDEPAENRFIRDFRAISGWDGSRNRGDTRSRDGDWYYNDSRSDFFTTYAQTNPKEDFAVSFSHFIRNQTGGYTYDPATGPTPEKFQNIERLLNSLNG